MAFFLKENTNNLEVEYIDTPTPPPPHTHINIIIFLCLRIDFALGAHILYYVMPPTKAKATIPSV